MRKLLCVLIVFLLLAGCEKEKTKENEISDYRGFKTDVYTEINDIKIKGCALYSEPDNLVLTLTSPESVKGMEIICKDGECKVNFHELSFLIAYEHLPFNAIFVSLITCAQNAKSATYENGCYKFKVKEYTYQLYIDEETRNFQNLMVDGTEILYFDNFEYIMGQTDS
jgi:hypothetical protein